MTRVRRRGHDVHRRKFYVVRKGAGSGNGKYACTQHLAKAVLSVLDGHGESVALVVSVAHLPQSVTN